MTYVTVRELIDLFKKALENGEISESDSVTDALILNDDLESLLYLIGALTPREYYNISEDVPNGSLYLRFHPEKSNGFDTGISFFVKTEKKNGGAIA